MKPLVSVLMPVYNGEPYLKKSIQSILNQTYQNFELILINDGSTDNSHAIICSFQDARIQYYENEKNSGLVYTLNRGIRLCNGVYIARMDADDIALPMRLNIQVAYLEKNPECIACGSWYVPFDGIKEYPIKEIPNNNLLTLCDTIFAHPTVLIRTHYLSTNELYYKTKTEDLWLWNSIFRKEHYRTKVFYNIPRPLLKYRMHPQQYTQYNAKEIIDTSWKLRRTFLLDFLTSQQLIFYFSNDLFITVSDLKQLEKIFQQPKPLQTKNLSSYSVEEYQDFKDRVRYYFYISLRSDCVHPLLFLKFIMNGRNNLSECVKVGLKLLFKRSYRRRY